MKSIHLLLILILYQLSFKRIEKKENIIKLKRAITDNLQLADAYYNSI